MESYHITEKDPYHRMINEYIGLPEKYQQQAATYIDQLARLHALEKALDELSWMLLSHEDNP